MNKKIIFIGELNGIKILCVKYTEGGVDITRPLTEQELLQYSNKLNEQELKYNLTKQQKDVST